MRIDPAWIVNNLDRIGALTVEHVYLTVLAVIIGFALSFALTVLVRARPGLYEPILGVTGTMYAIPSLALFALLTPITGVGTVLTAEIALVSYTLLILTRNMVEGLRGVPGDVLEAAAGMGYTSLQRLLRVELPLALPVVIAGLRIATVSTVALVTVTALTGLGGLGYLIINLGVQRGSFGATPALTGLVLCVVLAIVADLLLLGLQRALTPWARRRAST